MVCPELKTILTKLIESASATYQIAHAFAVSMWIANKVCCKIPISQLNNGQFYVKLEQSTCIISTLYYC